MVKIKGAITIIRLSDLDFIDRFSTLLFYPYILKNEVVVCPSPSIVLVKIRIND